MYTDNHPVHHTFTNKIPDSEGGGWEFFCVECSYRVRYTYPEDTTNHQQLQILDTGDPTARHTSNQFSQEPLRNESGVAAQPGTMDLPADDQLPVEDDLDEENWLNPEIRAFLDQLLNRLDP